MRTNVNRFSFLALMFLACISAGISPARAEEGEAADEAKAEIAPYCDFKIDFPSEPYVSRRCPEEGGECFNVISYTQVFELTSTVNFRVTCNRAAPGMLDKYNGDTMQMTLAGMVGKNAVEDYDIAFQEIPGKAKVASLSGSGKTGLNENIYVAELWIGQNSVFTIEAELIGEHHESADQAFGSILKSVGLKDAPAKAEEDQKKEEEKKKQ